MVEAENVAKVVCATGHWRVGKRIKVTTSL